MSAAAKIEPALTAEEWGDEPSVADFHPFLDQHKIAAVALHGQPFGFTREDVAFLRRNGGGFRLEHDLARYNEIADRIEALLPPE